jgi:CO/xanthine dehydrogenase Mo-binding subunit
VEVSDAKTKFGNVSCAYPFGVHVAEVEVDADTGLVSVLNVVAAHDVGKLLNPMIAEGQVEGGVAQGMGFALTEQMQVASGKTINPGFQDYKIPSTLDMPEIACIFVESQDPHGPYVRRLEGPLHTPTDKPRESPLGPPE